MGRICNGLRSHTIEIFKQFFNVIWIDDRDDNFSYRPLKSIVGQYFFTYCIDLDAFMITYITNLFIKWVENKTDLM
jgi:hypothetical protein